jgi:cytochrome P450
MTILETGIATPTGPEFNPFDPQFLADLYVPFFAEYRACAGFYSPALDYWVLTRYVHVRAAFRHTTLYSAANALSPIQSRSAEGAAIMARGLGSVPTVTNTDLGSARARAPHREPAWGGNRLMFMIGQTDEPTQARVARGMVDFWRSMKWAQFCFGLLVAGHQTTTNLLCNGVRRFLEHRRDAWDVLRAEPAAIPNAIEQVLRFDPSVVIWRRKTKQAVRIGDGCSARRQPVAGDR